MNKSLLNLLDNSYVSRKRREARRLTGGGPSCAAFLSLVLVDAGLIKSPVTWTANIVGSESEAGMLEKLHPCKRIYIPRDVLPGDIIVTRDLNSNGAPDHVGFALGTMQGEPANPFVQFCDNQGTYFRNLGKGAWFKSRWVNKTPMAYIIRLAGEPVVSDVETQARQKIVNHLAPVYSFAVTAGLSGSTLRNLNLFRHSPELRGYDPEGD